MAEITNPNTGIDSPRAWVIVVAAFFATTSDLKNSEHQLLLLNPKFIGEDNQEDTYFNVAKGRLKLREGNIENSLI